MICPFLICRQWRTGYWNVVVRTSFRPRKKPQQPTLDFWLIGSLDPAPSSKLKHISFIPDIWPLCEQGLGLVDARRRPGPQDSLSVTNYVDTLPWCLNSEESVASITVLIRLWCLRYVTVNTPAPCKHPTRIVNIRSFPVLSIDLGEVLWSKWSSHCELQFFPCISLRANLLTKEPSAPDLAFRCFLFRRRSRA